MCGGHLESDSAHGAGCRNERKGELALMRGTCSVHKQEGESNAEASLHANAKCGSKMLSTSLYANVGLEVMLQQEGRGTSQEIRNFFRKRNHNKSLYGNERLAWCDRASYQSMSLSLIEGIERKGWGREYKR